MVIIVMGVSGSGKTTIGWQLAARLGWRFEDADDWHPSANLDKMRQGIPLTDGDRIPWLTRLQAAIDEWRRSGQGVVLACSALKQSYRLMLRCDQADVGLVYLKGTFQQLCQRMTQREGHFMPSGLLRSQFDALEEPEEALVIAIEQSPEAIVQIITNAIAHYEATGRFRRQ